MGNAKYVDPLFEVEEDEATRKEWTLLTLTDEWIHSIAMRLGVRLELTDAEIETIGDYVARRYRDGWEVDTLVQLALDEVRPKADGEEG